MFVSVQLAVEVVDVIFVLRFKSNGDGQKFATAAFTHSQATVIKGFDVNASDAVNGGYKVIIIVPHDLEWKLTGEFKQCFILVTHGAILPDCWHYTQLDGGKGGRIQYGVCMKQIGKCAGRNIGKEIIFESTNIEFILDGFLS